MSCNDKIALRVKYREIRKNIPDRKAKEKSIADRILQSELYKSCSSLFIYSATGSEVNLDSVFKKALSDGKNVALPLCTDREGNMEFYFLSDESQLKCGMYGIKEPIKEVCIAAESDKYSLCLVPGLSFDRYGGRLGYGKGYYDRFLPEFKGISAGVCFEGCISDGLILDEHDKKVNYLISDKKIYIFSDNKEE
ncbi:MAG: 5-formyltetrahydrofolate cyclo-ligase [Acutalibacteraceae bacterium]|nr:5-formyltetrahydrofolate cyclo-ligase [Acutalibacteraceae bacterium]